MQAYVGSLPIEPSEPEPVDPEVADPESEQHSEVFGAAGAKPHRPGEHSPLSVHGSLVICGYCQIHSELLELVSDQMPAGKPDWLPQVVPTTEIVPSLVLQFHAYCHRQTQNPEPLPEDEPLPDDELPEPQSLPEGVSSPEMKRQRLSPSWLVVGKRMTGVPGATECVPALYSNKSVATTMVPLLSGTKSRLDWGSLSLLLHRAN
jgi:hypothetical protein